MGDFPIKPEDLVARSKEVLTLGLGTKDEGACLAEGFEFCAAVVGPIGKEEYLAALGDFKLEESFDVNAQYHMFRVDPFRRTASGSTRARSPRTSPTLSSSARRT